MISEDDIDIDYRCYDFDMMSIMFGLQKHRRRIPTRKKNWVNIFYNCNLAVNRNLTVTTAEKKSVREFNCYEQYLIFLSSEISLLVKNANDQHRMIRYTPLTTISTGYDSPACAVLAKNAGCLEAITFTRARANFANQDDSGKEIGNIIGLEVHEYDPEQYLAQDRYAEADFICRGTGGDDVYICAAEELLEGKILFTGHGAGVWERLNTQVSPNMVRRDPSGCSLDEFRFRAGFLHIPVPFIGFACHASIHRISNSVEMRPWSLQETTYDKPIPRRIVEDAGVPRHLFGQDKKAVARPYHMTTGSNNPLLQTVLSKQSYADFKKFLEGKPLYSNKMEKITFPLMNTFYHLNLRFIRHRKIATACARYHIRLPEKPFINWKYSKTRTWHSFLFHWSHAKLRQRYVQN